MGEKDDQCRFGLRTFDEIPVRSMVRHWKTDCAKRVVIADLLTGELKGSDALLRALVLRRLLRKVLSPDEENVGILIPPCVPAVLVNAALTLDKRVTVNLNYTVSPDVMNKCIAKVKIRHLITSRKVMEKFNYEPNCEVIYLEDLKDRIGIRNEDLKAKKDELALIVESTAKGDMAGGVLVEERVVEKDARVVDWRVISDECAFAEIGGAFVHRNHLLKNVLSLRGFDRDGFAAFEATR